MKMTLEGGIFWKKLKKKIRANADVREGLVCAACGNSGFRPPTNGTSPTTRERRRFEAPQWAVMIQRVVLIFTLVFAPSSSIPIPNSQIGITSFFLFFLPLHLFSSIALISARFYTFFFQFISVGSICFCTTTPSSHCIRISYGTIIYDGFLCYCLC